MPFHNRKQLVTSPRVSGSGFDLIVALILGQSMKAHLFRSVFVAEVAEADGIFAGLRHEPGGFRDGL